LKPLNDKRAVFKNAEVAFTPKGGCPLKHQHGCGQIGSYGQVAFTPKGGCPLKPAVAYVCRMGLLAR